MATEEYQDLIPITVHILETKNMNRRTSSEEEDVQKALNDELILTLRSKLPQEQIIDNITNCLHDGADINAQNTRGKTILHIAIEKNYLDVVKFLLSLNAKTDIKNKDGETAYLLGGTSKNGDMAKLFNCGRNKY